MIENISNILPVISILVSLYALHLITKLQKNNKPTADREALMMRDILSNQKNIQKLEDDIYALDDGISSWKLTLASDMRDIGNKITDLYNRWDIVSDDRITSIPQNNKEWWEAKEIVAQTPQKVWKPKNLSQSKSGFINENAKYSNHIDDDEVNQDFSDLSDEDFENILDDESDDTGSSSATDQLQQRKPKPKKAKQQTM